MDAVERIRYIARARGIKTYKMEQDLGFANGYFNALKRGEVPASRLSAIASYFGVSAKYLLGEPDEYGMTFEDWHTVGSAFGAMAKERCATAKSDAVADKRIAWFFLGVCPLSPFELRKAEEIVGCTLDQLAPQYSQRIQTRVDSPDAELQAAFFGGYADGLTQEEKDVVWRDAQDFARFRAEQLRKEKKRGQ